MQPTFLERAKSIAGGALVGIGTLLLHENLRRAAAQMSGLPGDIPSQALGTVPAVVLTAARVLQEYAVDHQRFLHAFVQHVVVLCCPLLLVMVGAVLSRDAFLDNMNVLKKNCRVVDLTAGHSTLK